jgi:tRNA-binding protein
MERKPPVAFGDFEKLEIKVGKIVEVDDFPRARQPSYRVKVDFGPDVGVKQSSAQATNYGKDQLVGLQVVAVTNFPAKNIAGFMSEVLILGVPGADGKLSLLTPSRPATLGGDMY